jgi:hypothetical protein
LIPPRDLWPQIQKIRNKSMANMRCGPHFSFVEPFVIVDHYPEASRLLTAALRETPSFVVHLECFSQFIFKSSAVLFLEPRIEPEGALHHLLDVITKLFPQCTDQIEKAPDHRFSSYHPLIFKGTYLTCPLADSKIAHSSRKQRPVYLILGSPFPGLSMKSTCSTE